MKEVKMADPVVYTILRTTGTTLVHLTLKSEMFVDDALTKYNKLLQRHPSIIQRIPQNQIASFLGITQYTLSRIRAKK